MPIKFLIDECLSPTLVDDAHAAGFIESTCVRNRGLAGTKDWHLMTLVIAEDYTLVTNNSRDFRGEGPNEPGGLHAKQPIHAGLVCLNCAASGGMDLDLQRALFQVALEQLEGRDDLVNQAIEVTLEDDGASVRVVFYDIPVA
ncbi:DUF5615 family PIN-like protein [Roseateles sp. BYS87W]|uniref:DUF5615 family PIN-like protein n=1 Tax=Pelomonas baiyunensis TaxID=3299026 RepID=A0ABW7GYB5_9BURK